MPANDSGIPTGEVIGQHVPTLHRDDRGLRWTCSCGHQSLNKRWSNDEPGVREALHHFTREHVIVTLTDEVAALRAERDEANQRSHQSWEAACRAEAERDTMRAERDRYKSQVDEIHEAYQSLAATQDELVAEVERMRPVVDAAEAMADDPVGPMGPRYATLTVAVDAYREATRDI